MSRLRPKKEMEPGLHCQLQHMPRHPDYVPHCISNAGQRLQLKHVQRRLPHTLCSRRRFFTQITGHGIPLTREVTLPLAARRGRGRRPHPGPPITPLPPCASTHAAYALRRRHPVLALPRFELGGGEHMATKDFRKIPKDNSGRMPPQVPSLLNKNRI